MKIEVDTEIEEISELKASIAIIEEAINRRENPSEEEETQDFKQATQDFIEEQKIPEPEPISQPEPTVEQPISQPEIPQQQPEQPSVDMSALSTSDYGQTTENRTMENLSSPVQDNKSIVKDIIIDLAKQNPDQPIQMSDIITKASEKNIQDEEARKLVDELKDSGEI